MKVFKHAGARLRAGAALAVVVGLASALGAGSARADFILNSSIDVQLPGHGCTLRIAIESNNAMANGKTAPLGCSAIGSGGLITIPTTYDTIVLGSPLPAIDANTKLEHSKGCVDLKGAAYLTINPGKKFALAGVGISADGSRNISMIDNNGGSLTIQPGPHAPRQCRFSNNKPPTPPDVGGVLINRNNGQVTISGADFVDSHARNVGGAIFNESGSVSIDDSLSNLKNAFVSNSSFQGGAMYNNKGAVIKIASSNYSISHNRVGDAGAGVFNNGGTLAISRGTGPVQEFAIKDNHSVKGGAIYSNRGRLTIDGAEIRDNIASDGSCGGICVFNQPATFTRSFFFNNHAHFFGGAIYGSENSTLDVSASTFTHNHTRLRQGSAIDIDQRSLLNIVNSTFVGGERREGVHLEGSGAGLRATFSTFFSADRTATSLPIHLSNSILNDALCDNVSDDGLNLQFRSRCPASIPRSNPRLASQLGNNGGLTPTLALEDGSPAIDSISIPNCADMDHNPVTIDQRGFKRPAGPACDMGAFEFGAAP